MSIGLLLFIGLLIFLLVLYFVKRCENSNTEKYTSRDVSFDYSSDCANIPTGACDYAASLSPSGEYELQWSAPDGLNAYQYAVVVSDSNNSTIQSVTTPNLNFVLDPSTYVDSRSYTASVQTMFDGMKSSPAVVSLNPYYPAYITSIVSQNRSEPLLGPDLVMRWIPNRFINTFMDSGGYPLLEDGSGWVLTDSKGTQVDSGSFGPEWPTDFAKTTHIPPAYAGQTLTLALTVISGSGQTIRPAGTSYFGIVVPQPQPNPPLNLSSKYMQT